MNVHCSYSKRFTWVPNKYTPLGLILKTALSVSEVWTVLDLDLVYSDEYINGTLIIMQPDNANDCFRNSHMP